MKSPFEFKGKYIIQGTIISKTGLHIGGSDEGIEIGGVDNPVIKDAITGQPYIPGSALKGKFRSTLEWSLGLIAPHPDHGNAFAAYHCHDLDCERAQSPDQSRWDKVYRLARLFGPAANEQKHPNVRIQSGPTRLTIRDVFLTEISAKELQQVLGTGVFTEMKSENALDRVTSAANPRSLERVPAGAEFAFTFIVDIYQEEDRELLRDLFGVMALLEDTALGGGGSRGHGQVEFKISAVEWRPVAYYVSGAAPKPIAAAAGKPVRDLAATFDAKAWQ